MIGRWVSLVGRCDFSLLDAYWKRPDAEVQRPVTLSSASGHYLNVLMTVEIKRSAFDTDDTWQATGDRTLGSYVRSH